MHEFRLSTERKILDLERNADDQGNNIRTLENWIDIYMPLRMQHQITETLRPTLATVKAKSMLSKVDSLIVAKLKDRVANDLGRP